MKANDDDVLATLSDLGRATNSLEPRTGFSDRVMAATDAESVVLAIASTSLGAQGERGLLQELMGPARGMLMFAALAAAAAGVFAVQSETEFESALMTSVDVLEVGIDE